MLFWIPHEASNSRYFLLAQVPLLPWSISGTIRFPFRSSDTCHPVSSQPTVCFPSPFLQHKRTSLRVTGYCLPTNLISFSLPAHNHWWDFYFFFQTGTKFLWSLGKTSKWGNNVCIHTVFSLQPYTGAGCPPEIYLHFCVMYDNKQILSSKRSYQGSLRFAFDDGKKQRQLTMSSSSWYNYVWTCLSFKLLTEQSVRLCITDFYKNVQPCKCINCRVFV